MSNDDSAKSEETIAELANVKKGKDRRFVMITKGGKVQSIVLFKRGNVGSIVKEAKENAKGQVTWGEVSGKGDEITFAVAKEDGFADAPVKDVALKAFLLEAGVKGRPKFEVVESHNPAPDNDDEQPEAQGPSPEQVKWEKQSPTLEKLLLLSEARQFSGFEKIRHLHELALKKADEGDFKTAVSAGEKMQELAKIASAGIPKSPPPKPES